MSQKLSLKIEDLPYIVFSAHSYNLISWLIRWRTKASYNHVMIMTDLRYVYTQNFSGFKKVPLSKYMKPGMRLKFWKIKDIKKDELQTVINRVEKWNKRSWWRRRYDFLGVLGQALGIKFFNNPWTYYCSEIVRKFFMGIIAIPKYITPKEMNNLFKELPGRMEVAGRWSYD